MFQLSLTANGMLSPTQGARAPGGADSPGLAGLLQQLDGAQAGFSAELQSLLMQMSPEMLRRLDEMLAGGMALPQAASRLLGGPDADLPLDTFAQLLSQGGAGAEGALDGDAAIAPGSRGSPFAQLVEGLPAALSARAELTQSPAALSAVAAMSVAPPAGGTAPLLAPQLANNLLEMGVPQQVGSKGWDGAVADRVMWMVQGEQQFARLRLNPPNLGPLEVRVSVNQEQTSVSFLANHAAVREALEAALPRLREMFDQQSLQLVRADVADPGTQHGDHTGDASDWPSGSHGSGTGEAQGEPAGGSQAPVAMSTRLVDLFA
jgi:flagellar hook-length control protein FliK